MVRWHPLRFRSSAARSLAARTGGTPPPLPGDGGAAVVGYDDPGYAAVCGGDIAEKCGDNTVVISKDKVVSSSLDGIAVGSSLDDIGVKKDDLKKDSFTLTADSKKYNAAAVTKGDMTVIAAIPA